MQSFVPVEPNHHFPIQNLPFGVFTPEGADGPRCGSRIGDFAVDLSVLADNDLLGGDYKEVFHAGELNGFMAMGSTAWKDVRAKLADLLSADSPTLRDNEDLKKAVLLHLSSVTLHLPARIGDYTDFYASRQHATNIGTMFRGKDNALMPNWLHLPVGYHGRSSSVVLSGTPVRRPKGQTLAADAKVPAHTPCRLMDFELEMAFLVGPGNKLGEPITMENASEHIFGLVLMNDWSARDIQKWEYVPLGPFGAKNFQTSITPWVVSCDALEPFGVPVPRSPEDPANLDYLKDDGNSNYNIDFDVSIKGEKMEDFVTVSTTNFRLMHWSCKQQLVHHTVTGCNMQPGDLLGSGTISGEEEGTYGSMLELCWKGTKPVPLGKETRKFLQDGDTVKMTGFCQGDGYRVGFGECTGTILPAL